MSSNAPRERWSPYGCDTPECRGIKEVVTPEGYVCRDCADELAEVLLR